MTLIDRYIPIFQFKEEHGIFVNVAPGMLLDASMRPETMDDPWVRTFIRLREFPDRLAGALGSASELKNRPAFGLNNFVLLGRDGDRELAFGLIGKFWQSDYGLATVDSADGFERFDEQGIAKLVLNISTEVVSDGRTKLMTETRVFCNDRKSIARFTPYWRLIRPVSGFIRRRLLARILSTAVTSSQN
jgi:hypothetical protein